MKFPNFKKAALTGGTAATLIAVTFIAPWEGRVYKPYQVTYNGIKDVLTVCDGHTGPDIVPDKVYTDAECDELLFHDVREAEIAVDKVIKTKMPDKTKAAFISFTFNVGAGSLERSTLAKMASAGDLVGACNQLSRWVRVKNVVVKGLVNRRLSEKGLCLEGLGKNPWYGV